MLSLLMKNTVEEIPDDFSLAFISILFLIQFSFYCFKMLALVFISFSFRIIIWEDICQGQDLRSSE